jgi:hypothetical protein
MKSLFNINDLNSMINRLKTLQPDAKPSFGKFTAHRMICHLMDQMNYGMGNKEEKTDFVKGPPMFIRHLARLFLPWPKGKAQTYPNMLETKPEEWEKDIEKLIGIMKEFPKRKDQEKWNFHPFFGKLDGKAWAQLAHRHADFHFKQFGV